MGAYLNVPFSGLNNIELIAGLCCDSLNSWIMLHLTVTLVLIKEKCLLCSVRPAVSKCELWGQNTVHVFEFDI